MGAILRPLTEKETPVKRKSPSSKHEQDQVQSLNQNQDGGNGTHPSIESEDQNEIATILRNSIAKYSMVMKSPTLRKLQELCKERNIKVSGRKDELKTRLGLGLPSSHIKSQTTRLKTKTAKPKISEGTVVQNSAGPGKSSETQNSLPSLKVTLPLKKPRPASVPEPVNICEKEDDSVYEADDEDEHFSHKIHRPRPSATISA